MKTKVAIKNKNKNEAGKVLMASWEIGVRQIAIKVEKIGKSIDQSRPNIDFE